MLYIIKGDTYVYKNNIFRILDIDDGVYSQILFKIIEQLEAMLSHHQRVFVYRFDLRCYEYTKSNTDISKFIGKLKYWVKSEYFTTRVGYVWVREQNNNNPKQHYHLAIFLDASKIDNPLPLHKKIEDLWSGSPYYPKHPYYKCYRNDYSSIQDVITRISYLAKAKTKETKATATNRYSCSRIRLHDSKKSFDFKINIAHSPKKA